MFEIWTLNFIILSGGGRDSKLFEIALPINKLCDSAKFSHSAESTQFHNYGSQSSSAKWVVDPCLKFFACERKFGWYLYAYIEKNAIIRRIM